MTTVEMLPAERLGSPELVAYQHGAVVSRTLLKRAAGTVTFFAFDQGQGLSEHTAPFDALAHVLEGEAEIVIAGQGQQVSAGEMILMPAHQPHALTAQTPFIEHAWKTKRATGTEPRRSTLTHTDQRLNLPDRLLSVRR